MQGYVWERNASLTPGSLETAGVALSPRQPRHFSALVDSGSAVNALPIGWAPEYPLDELTFNRSFKAVNGSVLKSVGEKEVVVLFSGQQGAKHADPIKFAMMPVARIVLSASYLAEHGHPLVLNTQGSCMLVHGTHEVPILREKGVFSVMIDLVPYPLEDP